MGSPPPYYSSAPKKSNTGLIVGIIIGVVCLCCILPIVGLGGLGFWGFNKMKGFVGCSLTFTHLQRAVEGYAQAHGDKLPNAATWETDIKPYYAKQFTKHDEADKMFGSGNADSPAGCTNTDGSMSGVAFNKDLSGKKLSEIKDPFEAVMLFEVPASGKNLTSAYKPQPFDTSPEMFGKKRGWYICHVSGHVAVISQNGVATDVNVNTSTQTKP